MAWFDNWVQSLNKPEEFFAWLKVKLKDEYKNKEYKLPLKVLRYRIDLLGNILSSCFREQISPSRWE